MKKNMGTTDKLIRVIIAALIGILVITGVLEGTLAIVGIVLAGIFLLTSVISFCPLYVLFGLNTCPKK
ncbi:MAG: DUF2892 domain-containing protein [Flavobacteriia bacterium]|jgi:hypothetical protein